MTRRLNELELGGRRCVAIAIARHASVPVGAYEGPLEVRWEDGDVWTFDTKSDWELTCVPEPWQDPYADVSPPDLAELGRWHLTVAEPGGRLAPILDQWVEGWRLSRNRMGEATRLEISFTSHHTLDLWTWEGELRHTIRPVF